MTRKIEAVDVKPGKFYVSKTEILVREIVGEEDADNIYWRDWALETGEPFSESLHLCSRRAIARWAGREANQEEIAKLNRRPLRFQTEVARIINSLLNSARPSTRQVPIVNTGRMLALFVGINEYVDAHISSLKVCADDANAICHLFSAQLASTSLLSDFTVDKLPTRNNILTALVNLSQLAHEDDLVLFYFSGHGVAESGQGYLLPRDVSLPILKYTAISMNGIREIIGESPASAKVIILDACHSGATIGKTALTMTPEFQKHVFAEAEGLAILASCKQGQLSWEWPEMNTSVFTHFLLEALRGQADLDQKGFVTVSDASRYVTDGVKRWSVTHSRPQTPTLQADVVGDIVLAYTGLSSS